MFAERLTLTSLLLTTAARGVPFFRLEQHRRERMFQRAGIHAFHAELPNGRVRYWAGGPTDARPLLMVHGFGGDALFGWYTQGEFSKDRFILVPDLLWFGDSVGAVPDCSPEYQAETLMQLMDHLGVREFDVAGISYGGFVALGIADRFPDRVGKLVIVDSPGHVYTLDDYHAMLDRIGLDSITEMVVPDDMRGVKRLMKLAYHRPPPVPSFVARDVYANLFVQHKAEKVRLLDNLIARADPARRPDYNPTQPTLIVWGEHDILFPLALAHRLADAIGPLAQVHVVPSANHAPNMERPENFNRAVRAFLAQPGRTARLASVAK